MTFTMTRKVSVRRFVVFETLMHRLESFDGRAKLNFDELLVVGEYWSRNMDYMLGRGGSAV